MKLQAIIAAAFLSASCQGPMICKTSTVGQYQHTILGLKQCKEFTSGEYKHYKFVKIDQSGCIELRDDNMSYSVVPCPKSESFSYSGNDRVGPGDFQGTRPRSNKGYGGRPNIRLKWIF